MPIKLCHYAWQSQSNHALLHCLHGHVDGPSRKLKFNFISLLAAICHTCCTLCSCTTGGRVVACAYSTASRLSAHGKPDRRLCHVYILAAVRGDGKTYTHHPLLRERCKHFFGEGTVRVQHDFKVLVGGTCRRLPGPAVYSTWVQADEMLSSPYVRPWRLVVVWGKTPSLPPSPPCRQQHAR